MKILAFMQNPWFAPGTPREKIDKYRTNQEFHQRTLLETMSGQRLVNAFGPLVFAAIHWDNVAPGASEEASGVTEVDQEHISRVITEVQPVLILTFGNLAEEALKSSIHADRIDLMACHPPNARHKTQADLGEFAIRVAEWVDEYKFKQLENNYKPVIPIEDLPPEQQETIHEQQQDPVVPPPAPRRRSRPPGTSA